jgi:release factor glutamine methyltransferase
VPEALLAVELDAAAAMLARVGVREPRREAAALWGACTNATPAAAWLERDRPAAPDVLSRFRDIVQRRAGGEPFAYAVGQGAFRTLSLVLDRRALIPRPETEGLVELVLRGTRGGGRGTGGVVADIGTGSGCIALSLAVEGRFDRVIATDSSEAAVALARENLAAVRPRTPVDIRVGNLLEPLGGERCRAIVANPPYLTDVEWAALDPAVREFEPQGALASGPDGLAATRALLQHAGRVLEPGGLLALEIDERRAEAVQALAVSAGWRRLAIHQDLFGRPRYALACSAEDV